MKAAIDELPDAEPLAPELEALLNLRRDIQAPELTLREKTSFISSVIGGGAVVYGVYQISPLASQFGVLLALLWIGASFWDIANQRSQRRWQLVLTILTRRAKN